MKNRKLCWKSKQDTSQCRFINLKDIIDIRVGANTTSNIRKHKIPLELDELCFSIVTKYRSLDLQAKNATIRSYWVSYFYDETKEHRIDVSNNTLSRKLEERMQRRDHLIQVSDEVDFLDMGDGYNAPSHWLLGLHESLSEATWSFSSQSSNAEETSVAGTTQVE